MDHPPKEKKRRRSGRAALWLTLFCVALAVGSVVAARLGWVERLKGRIYGRAPRLAVGDFPAGVMAPVDDVVKVPTRAVVIGVVPRGSVAPLLLAAGDAQRVGLFRAAYAIDVHVSTFKREADLRQALIRGADNGGVDLATLPVSSLAMSASLLRDAAPRVLMLVGRSRGHDVIGATGAAASLGALAGKRIGVEPRSLPWYVLLWALSRAGLSLRDVQLVDLDSSFEAGEALSSGAVDAVAGFSGDVGPVLKELSGHVVTTTADAPHLVATVLVSRGDFAARYPDGIRRILRGVLEANEAVLKDVSEAARFLGEACPELGDPTDAIREAPPATLQDNLAFFGLADEAPVTYFELFESAAVLNRKLFGAPPAPSAEDTADLGPLKYVSSARGP